MFKMCRRYRSVSGHIVLEVSVLMPAITLWIIGMVAVILFTLDMSALKSEVMNVSNETAAVCRDDGNEKKDHAELGNSLSRRLTVTSFTSGKVMEGSSFVIAQGSVRMSAFPFIKLLPGRHVLAFTARSLTPVNDWEKYLRMLPADDHNINQ